MNKPLRSLLRRLRRDDPPLLPVRVYVHDSLPHWGDASITHGRDGRPARFVVRLRRAAPPFMEQILMHEWAHCLTWQDTDDATLRDHCPGWQATVGRLLARHLYHD